MTQWTIFVHCKMELLKFTIEESHAIDLLNGKLFMRPACYYWDLEKGQGDLREGAVSPIGQIYKNPNYAIFCFSYVEDTDIKDGKVEIDKKLVDDCAKNGFVTIIRRTSAYGYDDVQNPRQYNRNRKARRV